MGFPFRGPAPATDDQVGILGSILDWAGRLNGALNPVSPLLAASESLPGIVQFASLAEASAGVSGKALSALRHSNVHIASSLADLNTRGLTLPSGSIMGLGFQDFTANNAGYLSPSFWYIDNGKITPLVPLRATTAAGLSYFAGLAGAGKTYPSITFDPGATRAFVPRANSTLLDEYLYLGATTGFYLWTGVLPAPQFRSGVASAGLVQAAASGEYVDITVHGQATNSQPAQQPLVTTPTGVSWPTGLQMLTGAIGSWSPQSFYLDGSGNVIQCLTAAFAVNQQFIFSGRLRRTVPAA